MDMKKLLDLITQTMEEAFDELGFEASYARVTVSNRPDLCEFQCNGAMALAKQLKKAPIEIAEQIAGKLSGNLLFEDVSAVKPGFLNLKLSKNYLADYLKEMAQDAESGHFGCERVAKPQASTARTITPKCGNSPIHLAWICSKGRKNGRNSVCRLMPCTK